MLDVEMPQANLFTHTAIIGKKEKNDTETTAYTLSCLTSFLTSWYLLTDRYGAAQTKITFLPFPYLLGQNHAEEKNYLALYDETFFSICRKKNQIKKLYYIQLLKNEQNGKYFNAAMNFILPHAEHAEFVIISENKRELKEYLDKEINYAPYIAIPKLQALSDILKNARFLRKNHRSSMRFTALKTLSPIISFCLSARLHYFSPIKTKQIHRKKQMKTRSWKNCSTRISFLVILLCFVLSWD